MCLCVGVVGYKCLLFSKKKKKTVIRVPSPLRGSVSGPSEPGQSVRSRDSAGLVNNMVAGYRGGMSADHDKTQISQALSPQNDGSKAPFEPFFSPFCTTCSLLKSFMRLSTNGVPIRFGSFVVGSRRQNNTTWFSVHISTSVCSFLPYMFITQGTLQYFGANP